MTDNVVLNPGVGGDTAAADDIAGIKYQRVKVTLGGDGTNDGDVASGNPMPVTGTVTANAGTNLNTSLLALEAEDEQRELRRLAAAEAMRASAEYRALLSAAVEADRIRKLWDDYAAALLLAAAA